MNFWYILATAAAAVATTANYRDMAGSDVIVAPLDRRTEPGWPPLRRGAVHEQNRRCMRAVSQTRRQAMFKPESILTRRVFKD